MKKCISCGMPLESAKDVPGGDMSKDWCVYCARPDGSLKSYDEALSGMSGFIVKTQGLDEVVARRTAQTLMSIQPAWKDHVQ